MAPVQRVRGKAILIQNEQLEQVDNTFPYILGPTLNFDRTYLQRNMKSNNRKQTCQSTGTCRSNLVNFGPETAENGWRDFAHPLNFRIGGHCQPYRMDVT